MEKETKNLPILGLHITSQNIYAVQGRLVNNALEIVAQGVTATPLQAVIGTSIEDPQRVGMAIRQLLRDTGIHARSATAILPVGGYMMRSLRLPDAPEAERRQLVRSDLEEAGVLPLRAGAFGFLWLPAPSGEDRRLTDICAYYTEDSQIDHLREALQVAGLNLDGVEPASLAVINAYMALTQEKRPLALLLPHEKHSDLCIHDGKRIRQMRRIAAGWSDIIMQGLPEIADNAQPQHRPLTEPAPLDNQTKDAQDTQQEQMRASSVGFLTAEVARSLAFYARQNPQEEQPYSLTLVGSPAATAALRRYIATSLPLPLDERTPLQSLYPSEAPLHDLAETAPEGLLATLGALVAGADAGFPSVDLSRQEQEVASLRRAPARLLTGMTGSTAWMLLAAAASIYLAYVEYGVRTRLAQLPLEISALEKQQEVLLRAQAISTAAHEAQYKAGLPASDILGRVAAATTPGVGLLKLRIDSHRKVVVEGKALDTRSLQTFAVTLGQGQAVRAPQFEVFRQNPKEGLTFRLAGFGRSTAKE